MIDCSNMTWMQMYRVVVAVWKEMKKRNPIGINMYARYVEAGAAALKEIAEGEVYNFTSECGPKEPKPRKKRTK